MGYLYKRCYILLFAAILTCILQQNVSYAQGQSFEWPFNHGDRVLIDSCLLRFDEPEESFSSRYDSAIAINHTVYFYPDLNLFFRHENIWYHVTEGGVTKSGNFALVDREALHELFPNSPPSADTTWLFNMRIYNDGTTPYRYCTNVVEFDTTVFGETVHAFSADIYSVADTLEYRITITDKYWLIALQRRNTPAAELTKYKIDNRMNNVGPYTYYFPALCNTLSYTYHEQMYSVINPPGYKRMVTSAVRDTSINDTTYYLGLPELYPGVSGCYPTRMDNDTLYYRYGDTEQAVQLPILYLGDIIRDNYWGPFQWLVDVSAINYEGLRTAYKYLNELPGSVDTYKGEQVFASKLGLFSSTMTDDDRYLTTDLTSFTHCANETWVEKPEAANELAMSLYPNPVSYGRGTITLHFARPVSLPLHIAITDALGRIVYTSTLPAASLEEIHIPVRSYLPGIYLLSASSGKLQTTKRFFLMH